MLKLSPIIKRDMNIRSRGNRFPLLVVLADSVLLVFELVAVFGMVTRMQLTHTMAYASFLNIYAAAVMLQFLMLVFIAPALTSAGISEELQKGSLDLMLMSRLTPGAIIAGRMLSEFLTILTVIASSLPLMLIPLLFGGVRVQDVILTLLLLTAAAVYLLSAGLFAGAACRTSAGGTALAYGITAALTVGTGLILWISGNVSGSGGSPAVYAALLNPALPVVSLLEKQTAGAGIFLKLRELLHFQAGSGPARYMIPAGILTELAVSLVFCVLAVLMITPRRKRISGHTSAKKEQKEQKE